MPSANLTQDKAVKSLAYQLADSLRSQYMDSGVKVPEADRLQAIQQLQQTFDLTLEQAEHALAQGFFASR